MKYFVFVAAPGCPVEVVGIYLTESEAKAHADKQPEYLEARKAKWDFGKLPAYSKTDSCD